MVEQKTQPLRQHTITETTFAGEQKGRFFEYIREYIEEFTRLNPYRPYSVTLEETAARKSSLDFTSLPPKTNDKINAMAEKIINHTSYPAVGPGEAEDKTAPMSNGPDIVVAAIFEKPPIVTVDIAREPQETRLITIEPPLGKNKRIEIVPAPKEDIDFAKRETIVFKDRFPSSTKFNVFMDLCKSYLKSPLVIEDGFGSTKEGHEQRRNYERAIKAALNFLGSRWSDQFQIRWDNHRITKNNQAGVITAFLDVSKSFEDTLSLEMSRNIKPALDRLKDPMDKVMELRKSEQFAESAKELILICRQAIEDFAVENTDLPSTKEKRIPRFQRLFLISLYGKLFGNRTIQGAEGLMPQIDMIIKDKSYERLFPFLKAIIEYDDIDFEGIFNRIAQIDEKEPKTKKSSNANLEAMQDAVWSLFSDAMLIPAERQGSLYDENQGSRREDLPSQREILKAKAFDSDLFKAYVVDDPKLLEKARRVMNQVTEEIVYQKPENNLLSRIFFRHTVEKGERRTPLTLAYLQSMQI